MAAMQNLQALFRRGMTCSFIHRRREDKTIADFGLRIAE